MKFLLRSFLSLVLCAVALFHLSALSPDPQLFSGNYSEKETSCFSEDEEGYSDDLTFHTTAEHHPKPKAARIYQRYHERLLACCNALSAVKELIFTEWLEASEKPISNTVYNSICLSSCYDYIFRLCPF